LEAILALVYIVGYGTFSDLGPELWREFRYRLEARLCWFKQHVLDLTKSKRFSYLEGPTQSPIPTSNGIESKLPKRDHWFQEAKNTS
jgi:hypothetical protein